MDRAGLEKLRSHISSFEKKLKKLGAEVDTVCRETRNDPANRTTMEMVAVVNDWRRLIIPSLKKLKRARRDLTDGIRKTEETVVLAKAG